MGMSGAPALASPGALSLAANVSSAAVRCTRGVFTAWGWLPAQRSSMSGGGGQLLAPGGPVLTGNTTRLAMFT
ncbi:hypothetical protein CGRA01v4_09077 [Colletotrichum graminicola]|nr:hypothetical protein CGRA01v4_09077 [Colletotrichum graminicola]